MGNFSVSTIAKVTVFLAIILLTTSQAFAVSGAIFTTTSSGTLPNGNLYANKSDVYLSGGPQPNAPCTSAGLPDGDYYFQVTTPSGSLLLSSDGIENRRVTVAGGFTTSTSGSHATAPGKCIGGIGVQLIPYSDTDNPGGEYKVWMTPLSSYDATHASTCDGGNCYGFPASTSKTDNFKVKEDAVCPAGDSGCYAPALPTITGYKFYDADLSGTYNAATEVKIPGWRIEKQPPTPSDVTYTDAAGDYSFIVAPSTTYTISEVMPNATWIATTPISGSVTSGASGNTLGPNFGNVCLGAGGGLTLGFWSNKNGQALFGTVDLALMVSLNLRNADGSSFDPASYSAFRTWLLNAKATNMAYMLSAQLAAMELNVLNRKVSGGALIYAPGTTSASLLGFAAVNTVMAEANTELGLHGLTLSGSPYRTYQEILKNVLDAANNNKNFLQAGPESCPFTTPY